MLMEAVTKNFDLQNFRALFYLVTPNETSYERIEDVPNFIDRVVPFFTTMIILEIVITRLKGREYRLNDGINSMSHGVLSQMHGLLTRPVELVLYTWLYNNCRFVDLPWNNPWVWFLAFLSVDFTYYWFHRWSHEVNIIWASHSVHHSAEDYNLTTALRQSASQKYYSMILNLGMSFFIPPPIFYVHIQFNLLYQFWIHTEIVNTVGPLEYILNTPSHHRVHHGRNPYCIDKNYGGTLIIWDRIFNTFQAEDKKVVYGLVHPNQFWNPLWSQVAHYMWIFGLVCKHKGIGNKLSAVFKGPGWEPGKPRMGLHSDLPEVEEPVQKYNSNLPGWGNAYGFVHFLLITFGYSLISQVKNEISCLYCLACIAFFIASVTCFGALYDNRKLSTVFEFLRCVMFLCYAYYVRGSSLFLHLDLVSGLCALYGASAVLWLTLTCTQYRFNVVTKKAD